MYFVVQANALESYEESQQSSKNVCIVKSILFRSKITATNRLFVPVNVYGIMEISKKLVPFVRRHSASAKAWLNHAMLQIENGVFIAQINAVLLRGEKRGRKNKRLEATAKMGGRAGKNNALLVDIKSIWKSL